MLLPVIVSAEAKIEHTEIADFEPAEDNYDEKINIANDTIRSNIDTWQPLPPGTFVGGSVEESKMRLNEMCAGSNGQIALASIINFQREYLYAGASQLYVRLPIYVDDEYSALGQVDFYIYEIAEGESNTINIQLDDPYGDPVSFAQVLGLWDDSKYRKIAYFLDAGNLKGNVVDPDVHTNPAQSSYIIENRIYCRLIAPIFPDKNYIFLTIAYVNVGNPFDVFFCASDFASDNIKNSHIDYYFKPAVDQYIYRENPVDADLGYSIVAQNGISGHYSELDYYYQDGYSLIWYEAIEVDEATSYGAVNFILEFEKDADTALNYTLSIEHYNGTIGDSPGVLDGGYWWELETDSDYIIASQPVNHTYTAFDWGGVYYQFFKVQLTINKEIRIRFVLDYNEEFPRTDTDSSYDLERTEQINYMAIYSTIGVGYKIMPIFMGIRSTIAIENESLNHTSIYTVGISKKPWYSGMIFEFFSDHWVDILGIALIAGGILLVPFTGGWSLLMVAAGVTILLYDNWDEFRDLVDKFVGMVIDGLSWLGNWLYKIAMEVWKALTWFVDQIIYYGAILLGMLIVAVAIFIFGYALQIQLSFWKMILALVDGDLEKAEKQAGKLTGTIKGMAGR